MMEMTLDQVLAAYMQRVVARAGNGLTRSMNHQLRSYPAIPEIIRRTAAWLTRVEQTFQFTGVGIRTMHLYWDLVKEHDDWGADVPEINPLAGTITFKRQAKLPYNQFVAAMAIGRRIGLFGGHGQVVLQAEVRKALKQGLSTAGEARASVTP